MKDRNEINRMSSSAADRMYETGTCDVDRPVGGWNGEAQVPQRCGRWGLSIDVSTKFDLAVGGICSDPYSRWQDMQKQGRIKWCETCFAIVLLSPKGRFTFAARLGLLFVLLAGDRAAATPLSA